MKKRICLIITLIISLFAFSSRVGAGNVMYFECEYDSYEEVNFNMVIRATHSDGPEHLFGGYGTFYHGQADQDIEGLWKSHQVEDYCWIESSSKIDKRCSIGNNATQDRFKMNDKICPASIRYNDYIGFAELWGQRIRYNDSYLLDLVFAGTKLPVGGSVSIIEDDEYIVYKIYSDVDKKEIYVFEAYSADTGQYFYINRNFNKKPRNFLGFEIKSPIDEIDYYQLSSAYNIGGNFWRVSDHFDALYASVSGYCSSIDDCEKNKKYVEVLSSRDNDTRIYDKVSEWYSIEGDKYTTINELATLINDNEFISFCNDFIDNFENGNNLSYIDDYNLSEKLNKLEEAYSLLSRAYELKPYYKNYLTNEEEKVDVYSSAISYVYYNVFGVEKFEDLLIKKNDPYYILNEFNGGEYAIETMINRDIKSSVDTIFSHYDSESIDKIKLFESLDEYNELFAKTIMYLESIYSKTSLTQNELEKLENLKNKMSILANEHDIFIIATCEDLIGEELNAKILSYFDIVRLAVPILLVILGILDFAKAFFSNDDSEMKKAQSKFIKRIFVAILFFFVPVLVNLLLTIANQVWDIINPDTCIRF